MFEVACLQSTWAKPAGRSHEEMFNWSVSIYFNKLNKGGGLPQKVKARLSECLNKKLD